MATIWLQFLVQIHQRQSVNPNLSTETIQLIKWKFVSKNKFVCISGLVASICKKLQLPHFVAIWRPNDVDFNANDSFTRNIFPQPQQYSRALYKIIKSFQWKKFAMIYDSDDALVRFQEIFPISYDTDFTGRSQIQSMRFHRLPDTVDGYLVMLKNLTKSGISSVILDLSLKNTEALLSQTHRVSMNNEYYVCIKSYDGNRW